MLELLAVDQVENRNNPREVLFVTESLARKVVGLVTYMSHDRRT